MAKLENSINFYLAQVGKEMPFTAKTTLHLQRPSFADVKKIKTDPKRCRELKIPLLLHTDITSTPARNRGRFLHLFGTIKRSAQPLLNAAIPVLWHQQRTKMVST